LGAGSGALLAVVGSAIVVLRAIQSRSHLIDELHQLFSLLKISALSIDAGHILQFVYCLCVDIFAGHMAFSSSDYSSFVPQIA
jgi:hypothetical protein